MAASNSHTFTVNSDSVTYTDEHITATYDHSYTTVTRDEAGNMIVTPETRKYEFQTERNVPKTGVMIVGWGGNNGTTVTAGILANKEGITWRTKNGVQTPNYYGSVTQASTVKLGTDAAGEDVHVPLCKVLPMVDPNDLVVGGWDISSMNLADGMDRAQVLEYDLQRQLYPIMKDLVPLPSIYFPDFIAANQAERADNVLEGTHEELVETIRSNIRDFKASNGLESVIVLWSANTERFAEIREGLNDTEANLMASIAASDPEVSPSTLFAVASILEGSPYINGSPQNTFVPGLLAMADSHGVHIGGDDFKSGQTKMKSVLVDFLVSAGIKPTSIVSYNHLGNNDGKNLSSAAQFRSKEISKSNVIDDVVESSHLYAEGEHPDHVVVIKYVPTVGDSKRALDEYTSEIFLGGLNTISLYNVCEDSLLASPLIIDLVLISSLMGRMKWRVVDGEDSEFKSFHPVASILSYLLKAPVVPQGTPVVNALFEQRAALVNLFRACVGLPTDSQIKLEQMTNPASLYDLSA